MHLNHQFTFLYDIFIDMLIKFIYFFFSNSNKVVEDFELKIRMILLLMKLEFCLGKNYYFKFLRTLMDLYLMIISY